MVFLFIAFKLFISELPDESNIVKITGILKDDIKKENRGRGKKSLIVKLKNYPEIDFMIGTVSLDETYSEKLTDENKTGDSITLFIEDVEFRRKIVKKEKIPFPENILHPEKIDIVAINNNRSNYLLLEDYRKAHLKNNYLGTVFFGILGLLMFILGMKVMRNIKTNIKN